MIGRQGEDSCGKSEIGGESPQKRKACTEINSSVTSDLYLSLYPICSSIHLFMSQSLFS
ncbi:hypothetical protein ACFX4W_18980 [Priestia sp. YIM B13489]|uniref:hypothetical protein n=1 Tax=Priestia megaterium TaxID=1404 RepID=UPI0036C4E7B5